jgi:predicted ATPase
VFAGENGSGKSTLLEAIADHIGLGRGGGSKDHRDVADEPAGGLASMLRFSWLPKIANGFFFRAETYFELVRYLEETAKDWPLMRANYGLTPLDQQSHGEAFLALFENRLGNDRRAIYLFDEPEAALSPQRLARFVRLLRRAELSRNVQILMATHSPVLMGYPGAQLLDLGGGAIRRTTLPKPIISGRCNRSLSIRTPTTSGFAVEKRDEGSRRKSYRTVSTILPICLLVSISRCASAASASGKVL